MLQTAPLFDTRTGHSLFGLALAPTRSAQPECYGVHLMVRPLDGHAELLDEERLERHLAVVLHGAAGAPLCASPRLRLRCESLDRDRAALEVVPRRERFDGLDADTLSYGERLQLAAGTWSIEVVIEERARARFTLDV